MGNSMVYTSGAAGLESGQFNRKSNLGMINVECRIKGFFLFYLLKRAERAYTAEVATKAGSDIDNSSIVNLHSSFVCHYQMVHPPST